MICGALTLTEPALPLAVALARATMPLPAPLSVSGPPEATMRVPPFPDPAVAELICAPPERLKAPPAVNVT